MKDNEIPTVPYQPWQPMNNPQDIKTLGKFGEELGECQASVMRCLIQGIDELEPKTGYLNRHWLEDKIADVVTNLELVIERFSLNQVRIYQKSSMKKSILLSWLSSL